MNVNRIIDMIVRQVKQTTVRFDAHTADARGFVGPAPIE